MSSALAAAFLLVSSGHALYSIDWHACGATPPALVAPVAAQAPPAAQATSAAQAIEAAIEKAGLPAGRAKMEEIARGGGYTVSERDLNALGYRYLGRKAFPEALAVFEFIVARFPASNNASDSLAEALAAAGDRARLEATLTAWLARSPADPVVTARAADLRALAARAEDERRHAYRPGQPTHVHGPYFGQTPPGTTPVLFAPGIVSLAFTNESFPSMAPDGREFFFNASGRTPGVPVAPPSGRARFGGDPPAVMVSRLGPEGWTFPEQAAFTAGYAAREPHISADNRRLYWEWFRAVPAGEPDPAGLGTGIWAAERTASGWSEPAFVGQAMAVTTSRSGEVYVTDLSEIAQGSAAVAKAIMKDGRFAGLERVKGGPEALRSEKRRNFAHPSIAPDGSYLIFDTGGPPSHVCFRKEDGSWNEPIDLSRHGLGPRDSVTSVSPDGKYLFLARGGDIYWVSAEVVEALRPARAAEKALRD